MTRWTLYKKVTFNEKLDKNAVWESYLVSIRDGKRFHISYNRKEERFAENSYYTQFMKTMYAQDVCQLIKNGI